MVREISSPTDIPTTGVVVLDFFATWCGPCKTIAPAFADLQRAHPTATFLKVNVDEAEILAGKYQVNILPTFVILRNGAEVQRVEGANIAKLQMSLTKAEKVTGSGA